MSAKLLVPDTIDRVPIASLSPHPKNPRQGDVGAIITSMQKNGVYRPLYVQRSTNHILAGTHTWRALMAEGFTEVPVIWLDVDDKTAKRILLADNRTNDVASYDDAALVELLYELSTEPGGLDQGGTGFDTDDLAKLAKQLAEPYEAPEHHCCRPD